MTVNETKFDTNIFIKNSVISWKDTLSAIMMPSKKKFIDNRMPKNQLIEFSEEKAIRIGAVAGSSGFLLAAFGVGIIALLILFPPAAIAITGVALSFAAISLAIGITGVVIGVKACVTVKDAKDYSLQFANNSSPKVELDL